MVHVAATMDRVFLAKLKLGNRAVLRGQSLYARKANDTSMLPPLLHTSCVYDHLMPNKLAGRVVVCDAQGSDRQESWAEWRGCREGGKAPLPTMGYGSVSS
jgi:hypothetical protein